MQEVNETPKQNCAGLTVQREARCTNDLLGFSDKELLKLAAKSIDLYLEWDGRPDEWQPMYYEGKTYHGWNPLEDDANALQLAVKLKLQINTDDDDRWGVYQAISTIRPCGGYNTALSVVEHGEDSLAATRKAIVMAAAKIGSARV